ncbi:MAG: hypothetical protein PHY28_04990, partial [Dehalococcoidales bacterium]|nr:hypothetical protein [Dehalococcoidales bacterium]
YTLKLVRETCDPAIADLQPCQYACLAALDTLFKKLDLNVNVQRDGATAEHNYCQYTITHF